MNLNISYYSNLLEKVLHKCDAMSSQSGMGVGGGSSELKKRIWSISTPWGVFSELKFWFYSWYFWEGSSHHCWEPPDVLGEEQGYQKGAARPETAYCPLRNQNLCKSIASACKSHPPERSTGCPKTRDTFLDSRSPALLCETTQNDVFGRWYKEYFPKPDSLGGNPSSTIYQPCDFERLTTCESQFPHP